MPTAEQLVPPINRAELQKQFGMAPADDDEDEEDEL